MAKLFYVGFNGYNQCPKNDSSLNVITEWNCTNLTECLNIFCTHKFLVVEMKDKFKIFGITGVKNCEEVEKKFEVDNFGSNDDFLIGSQNNNIWQYDYDDERWIKLELSFNNPKEKSIWEKCNRILKFSFRVDIKDVILLIDNGSVWLLSTEKKLKLIHPYDVEKAIDIVSGLEHTLILTESGCVLSFGNGRGALGHGDLNDSLQPVQIQALEGLKIIKIGAGGWHSAVITDTGGLYVWGWNKHGQLSVFEENEEIGLANEPIFVEIKPEEDIDVVDVACGNRHTVVKLENGNLYASGWNYYSQLGVGSSDSQISKFTKVTIVENQNRRLLCGPWYTILWENLSGNASKVNN